MYNNFPYFVPVKIDSSRDSVTRDSYTTKGYTAKRKIDETPRYLESSNSLTIKESPRRSITGRNRRLEGQKRRFDFSRLAIYSRRKEGRNVDANLNP